MMDPQVIEQQMMELALVMALSEHSHPEQLFAMAKMAPLSSQLSSEYLLSQSAWALAA